MANEAKGAAAGTTESGAPKGGNEATGATAATGGTTTGTQDGKATDDAAAAAAAAAATEGKGGEGTQGKDGEGKPQPKAPATYSLKAPEGGRITESALARVEEIARANDWTNEEAQAELLALDETIKATIAEQSDAFLAATKADKEIGGEKLEATLKQTTLVLDRFAPKGTAHGDAFRKMLDESGYGNHPEVVRFMASIGRQMQEDRPASGGDGGGDQPRDHASVLYGKKS